MSTKVTYTLDDATVDRIGRIAGRLGLSRSGVVREAVAEYAARVGRLTEAERERLLRTIDLVMARIPSRPVVEVERELAALRAARRRGGRGTRSTS
jgi:predicted transcriptional regulator